MDKLAQIIINDYPKNCNLTNGEKVVLRPLMKTDEVFLRSYFQGLPLEDRLCFKEDVTDPKTIAQWIYELDYDAVLPVIAQSNGRIVGDATLQFSPIGWTKHQAELRLSIDPSWRRHGLGTLLLQNLINISARLGLEQLTAEIPLELNRALRLFKKFGFDEVTMLKGFVRNLEGRESDLVLMIKYLSP